MDQLLKHESERATDAVEQLPAPLKIQNDDKKTPLAPEDLTLARHDRDYRPILPFIGQEDGRHDFYLPDVPGKCFLLQLTDAITPGGFVAQVMLDTHVKAVTEGNSLFGRKQYTFEHLELARAADGSPTLSGRLMSLWLFVKQAKPGRWCSATEWENIRQDMRSVLEREERIELDAEKIRVAQFEEREAARRFNRNPAAAMAASTAEIVAQVLKQAGFQPRGAK